MSRMSHGRPVSLVLLFSPWGLPSLLKLAPDWNAHPIRTRPWKALSQLSQETSGRNRLKPVGGLSEGLGDCAETRHSPGSGGGGVVCGPGIWPCWAGFSLLPAGRCSALRCPSARRTSWAYAASALVWGSAEVGKTSGRCQGRVSGTRHHAPAILLSPASTECRAAGGGLRLWLA